MDFSSIDMTVETMYEVRYVARVLKLDESTLLKHYETLTDENRRFPHDIFERIFGEFADDRPFHTTADLTERINAKHDTQYAFGKTIWDLIECGWIFAANITFGSSKRYRIPDSECTRVLEGGLYNLSSNLIRMGPVGLEGFVTAIQIDDPMERKSYIEITNEEIRRRNDEIFRLWLKEMRSRY